MTLTSRCLRRASALVALALIGPLLASVPTAAPQTESPVTEPALAPAGEIAPLRADTTALAPAGGSPSFSVFGEVSEEPRAEVSSGTVAPFVAVGFSWTGGADHVEARVTMADGTVTEPFHLEADPEHAEDAAVGAIRVFTDPLALPAPATGFDVVVPISATDVQVHYIRETTEPEVTALSPQALALEPQGAADGIPGPDGIISRYGWGARQRVQASSCGTAAHGEGRGCVADTGVLNAVVHHTVNSNSYSADAVPAMLRSIQAFHMDVRGWDDIGYNFVVDRFGRIWEGRDGGPDRAVIGGHTGGFNTGSVGVSVLGTFDSVAPNESIIEGVSRVIAYKFAQRNVDPHGSLVLTSRGSDRFPDGAQVPMSNISGHLDLGQTSCPGGLLYARLPDIRNRVAALLPIYTGEVTDIVRTGNQVRVAGYALHRGTAAPVIVRLEIDGTQVATATADRQRADVAARFGALGGAHGFEFTAPVTVTTGRLCVFELASNVLIGCREVNPVTPPFGDLSRADLTLNPTRIEVGGWAIEPDTPGPMQLHVYIDNVIAGAITTGVPRPDVNAIFPRYAGNHGFAASFPSTPGAHSVCVYGINTPAGDNSVIGCRTVTVPNARPPIGSLDVAVGFLGGLVVGGWAADPDTAAPIPVHVYIDGAVTGIVANAGRSDVGQAFPALGPNHGFAAFLGTTPGTHQVCVYGINNNLVGPHTTLGCRTVTIAAANAAPPVGALDVAGRFLGGLVVAGWAADPDTAAPIPVHVYIDGVATGLVANGSRADVGQVYPAFGSNRGFGAFYGLTPGPHSVCVYAINNNLVGPHTTLGCRTV